MDVLESQSGADTMPMGDVSSWVGSGRARTGGATDHSD